MKERSRQRLMADTSTTALVSTDSALGAQQRSYAMPQITDRSSLRSAIKNARTDEQRAHVRQHAKRLRAEELIPADWNMSAEMPAVLSTLLILEEAGQGLQVLAEGAEDNGGVMTVRMPFYVSNSVARLPGFAKKIYFGASLLPKMVAEGNRRINEQRQPMTVYSRHAHAVTGERLPVGRVTQLEIEGRIGYATIEVAPTSEGKDIQALIRARHLNASSLRSGTFQMAERKVNGELMLEPTSIVLDGIDFAPDSPAMPTYGVEVLAAEAAVESAPTQVPRRNIKMDEITVDGLRDEFPQIVKEIEAPLKARVVELETRVTTLITAEDGRKRDALVAEIAAKFPNPDEALPELQKLCAEAKNADEVAALAMPLLLENLSTIKVEPKVSPADRLRAMFPGSGRGQTLTAEAHDDTPNIDGFAVPAN